MCAPLELKKLFDYEVKHLETKSSVAFDSSTRDLTNKKYSGDVTHSDIIFYITTVKHKDSGVVTFCKYNSTLFF